MHMLTAKGWYSGLSAEDPYAHISKLKIVFKCCVVRQDLDMNVIGMRVFPLSLINDAIVWFTELPYNIIYSWYQLKYMFLVRYYQVSKKFNHKDTMNNFVVLIGESMSIRWTYSLHL